MKIIRILSFVLITIIIACCKNNPVEPDHDMLIPLKAGNYWLYQGYYLNPDNGSIVDSIWGGKYGFIIHYPTAQIENIASPFNYQISICHEDLKPIDDTNILLYGGSKLIYQNNSGFYYSGIVRKDTLTMYFNDLIFPYPVEKGTSVRGHVFFYSALGNGSNVPDEVITEYTCVSTDSLYTTPLGEFRCIVYQMIYIDYYPLSRAEVYYFIKPGLGIVGMVNMTYHYSTNKYRYFSKYVVTDYKIK